MAGLPEDLESAELIEQRWKADGLNVTKPKYNVLLSYPDQNNPNRYCRFSIKNSTPALLTHVYLFRVTLTIGTAVIIQTAGVEEVYDPTQAKTVNPFLAYTPNGTVTSVSFNTDVN